VAIVTGASGMRGIGRAIALRFAKDGLDVALVDIQRDPQQIPPQEQAAGWRGIESVQDEIAALGGRAISIYADISDPAQVRAACDRTIRELGDIDVLVNNARAGIGRDRAPIVELDVSEFDRVMNVNVRGTFLFAQAVGRHLQARGRGGHIINMSSLSGKRGLANHAAYCTSKFAINGFTQVLALELGPHGINVNAICPGLVDTGRFSLGEKLAAERAGVSLEEAAKKPFEERTKVIALGRVAVADDVAGMAAFLISPDARHITGQAINVCGGETFH
jgi:3-oxoacyl-[acyl-carrier protein] reductase/meso-butanediol dehydrogenase/(S,S)-butanediol dehydrogenase/diacetyl reductase